NVSSTVATVVGGVGAVTISFLDELADTTGSGNGGFEKISNISGMTYNDPFIGFTDASSARYGGERVNILAKAWGSGIIPLQDVLESAPLDSPVVHGGGGEIQGLDLESDPELSTLYGGFAEELSSADALHKFENKLSDVKTKDANIIIGFHYANWCIYCKDMKSKWGEILSGIKEMQNKNGKKYAIIAIDEEKNRNKTITTIPSIIIYDTGKKTAYKYHGKSKPKKILKWIS